MVAQVSTLRQRQRLHEPQLRQNLYKSLEGGPGASGRETTPAAMLLPDTGFSRLKTPGAHQPSSSAGASEARFGFRAPARQACRGARLLRRWMRSPHKALVLVGPYHNP